jgi:hypothetical protein
VDKVCKIISEDWQSTILEITGRLGLSFGTYQQILMGDFNMWWISMKFVPHMLIDEQKQ